MKSTHPWSGDAPFYLLLISGTLETYDGWAEARLLDLTKELSCLIVWNSHSVPQSEGTSSGLWRTDKGESSVSAWPVIKFVMLTNQHLIKFVMLTTNILCLHNW